MKYCEILSFDPITEVIQIDNLKNPDYQQSLIKTFVYPDYFLSTVIPQVVKQMRFGGYDQKGIQVIGNYGTGKSHLMSLVSLVAEHGEYLDLVGNDQARSLLEPVAGKFKVLRFEMGTDKRLWDIIVYQLQNFLTGIGVDFRFDPDSMKMYREQMEDMLAAFEDRYPGQGLLLVIDEMLSYLEVRTEKGLLANDLQVLQALGQLCSDSRFSFMFGVQEMIYHSNKFQFQAETLMKVKDRYVDLTIRRDEVAYVVQNRLLRKSPGQKAAVRRHLEKFLPLFSDMHSHLQDYIDLFPVHPAYFDNFQKIRIGKSQREVLRTLSSEFERIASDEIPADNPGLISYDSYFQKMLSETGNMTIPDFKTVADTVALIHGKIDNNFDRARAPKALLGKRIVNATAIKLLQGDLDHPNGARAEVLTDELCYTDPMADDHELLVSIVDATAKLIVRATSGQYFEHDENNDEYHLRTKGGVNFEQRIAEYAESLEPARRDEAFFRFLTEYLEIADTPYRAGFKIYEHQLEWRSRRVTRDGYIFMGGANEKSTTQPRQSFYMVFMPMFQDEKKRRNADGDEIYFVMDDMPGEFKELVCRFGAAYLLMTSADSSQRLHYRQAYETLLKKVGRIFAENFLDCTKVYYRTEQPRALKTFHLPGQGATHIDFFNRVASDTFEEQFCAEAPHYPCFTLASSVITRDNRDRYMAGAKAKLIKPSASDRYGEAVLSALQCMEMGEISTAGSIYAQSVLDKLDQKGVGKVLNRDEILSLLPNSDGRIWYSTDFRIEADLEFLVLCALVVTGEIEITLGNGTQVNASNIDIIKHLDNDHYWAFSSVKRPKGISLPVVKALTTAFCGADLSGRLDDSSTYAAFVACGRRIADEVATFVGRNLSGGAVTIAGMELIPDGDVVTLRDNLTELKNFADRLVTYTSAARLKNMPWDVAAVMEMAGYWKEYARVADLIRHAHEAEGDVAYLQQALQYVPAGHLLREEMQKAVDRFRLVVEECRAPGCDASAIKAYMRDIAGVKSRYVDWYMGVYRTYMLNEIDQADKSRLLNSSEYRALVLLSGLPIFNNAALAGIQGDLAKLKAGDPGVVSVMQSTPFAGFDPRGAQRGKSIREIESEIVGLYHDWIVELRAFVADPAQQQALSLMADAADADIAARIVSGDVDFSDTATARVVADFVGRLSAGYERVEITPGECAALFARPLSADDAVEAFGRFVRSKTFGKDLSKVRMVFVNNANSADE